MAAWLVRAIVVENVAVRSEGSALDLPAGPDFRLEKEIKNAVAVIAKTCHYWLEHMWELSGGILQGHVCSRLSLGFRKPHALGFRKPHGFSATFASHGDVFS